MIVLRVLRVLRVIVTRVIVTCVIVSRAVVPRVSLGGARVTVPALVMAVVMAVVAMTRRFIGGGGLGVPPNATTHGGDAGG